MAESLNPTAGIRLLLEREEVAEDAQRARYVAAIYTVDACFRYRAELTIGGAATLTADADAASAEDEEKLHKLAKSTARAAQQRLTERLSPWPPRVLRWRGPDHS